MKTVRKSSIPANAKRATYHYISPRSLYAADDASYLNFWGLFVLAIGICWDVLGFGGLSLHSNLQLLFQVLAMAGSGVAAWVLCLLLRKYGDKLDFGLRPIEVAAVAGTIWVRCGPWRWLEIKADEPHSITMREHKDGAVTEARAQERANQLGLQLPDYYRRSYEIIADDGKRQVRLAEVASEAAARALTRWILEFKTDAAGVVDGAGIRARAKDAPGAMPVDPRQQQLSL